MVTFALIGILFIFMSIYESTTNSIKKSRFTFGTFLSLAICMFISTIRTDPLGDLGNYREIWQYSDFNAVLGRSYQSYEVMSSEFLYKVLNFVCHSLVNNFNFFLFIECLIVNMLLLSSIQYFLKYNDRTYGRRGQISLTAFVTIFYCLGLYNVVIVRQTLCVAVCLFSIRYINDKKFWKFLICVIIATLIHRSGIAWLISYFIFNFDSSSSIKRTAYIMAMMFGVAAFIILLPKLAPYLPGILGAKVQLYLSSGNDLFGQTGSLVARLAATGFNIVFIIAVCYYLFKEFKQYLHDRFFVGCFNLYVFGATLQILSLFASNQFARLATPFSMTHVFLVGYFLTSKYVNNRSKIEMYCYWFLYYLFRLFTATLLGMNGFQTIFGVIH